ncbi:Asp-tRNA(Asn)/Glu-tRNA(Gln) amidotransferase subunit GatA [Rhodopirellula sp. MGV]|uniref:Asp-tRNA(Asn)/Glu-tRNA(Gln) amidotransferase subunit GatA n=1 Tax=Rhodopirellula sp. MGV TaxID=2023130 RepID=UPI000B9758EC|nr:Asp-tRNA(Asn)/Glu-tRNA(Gln) amidotransferase subunit GatA [Rhodopirellula sp. MGV]OYP30346.1 Asp-tRNA(Asn)/Glu-tRNA(Gln) amidotransferase GatCAB subunit A [Rhodopirellula sp. MGV]PNY34702.1 Asp-tRNA(Asn)/Glu-tRNA(Gln) amidotransferase subunit GatA [Rhodopirellula baltica]
MLDSAFELLRKQADGEVSAVEIAGQAIDAIEASQSLHNAYTHVDRDLALATAKAIDEKRAAGKPLGALAGVPVAVKDVLCTADMPTTCSSEMLRGFRPPYDATVVEKLRAADAVIVGKTNMDEFAMGGSTETGAFGATTNPWDTKRTPGGSSGGATAAVAAQTVPLSLGTDTGGSIRQPSAFCGVTGLKPTYGRVSRYGLVAFASSLDQIGPIAWSAKECALLMNTIAGHEPRDSTSLNKDVPDYVAATESNDLRGMRIGVLRESMEAEGVDADVRAAVAHAIGVYAELGAEIIDVDLPHREYWVPTYYVIAPSEASSNLSRYDGAHYGHRSETGTNLEAMYCKSRAEGFGDEVKRRIMIGTYALSEGYADQYYNQALKVRRLIRGDYDAAFSQVDVLLGPVTPTPAFELGAKLDDPIQMYLCDLFTVGANLAGVPAMSLPAGLNEQGLPLGIQLQAPALEEARLLFAASAFQSATDYHTKRPRG